MNAKNKFLGLAVAVVSLITFGHFFAKPLVAQARAALVRDVDTPALAPFSGIVSYDLTALNTQQLLTTVPAGKRLVITNVSYESGGTAQLVFLCLRNGQFGPVNLYLQVNPPHASVTPGLTLQDGNQPSLVYFEAGSEVWVSASVTTAGARDLDVTVAGYFVTP